MARFSSSRFCFGFAAPVFVRTGGAFGLICMTKTFELNSLVLHVMERRQAQNNATRADI